MRLLFITSTFPNPFNPTKGTFNRHLASALARENEVQVVAPVSWVEEIKAMGKQPAIADGWRHAVASGVETYHPRYYYPPRVAYSQHGWFYWRSVRGAVLRSLDTARPDAVLAYWTHPDGAAAVQAARLAGVPSAVIVGGSDVLILTRSPNRRRCVVDVLRETDRVLCVSEHLRAKVMDLGIPEEKVHLWRQGVDLRTFRPGDQAEAQRRLGIAPKGKVVVWVGHLVPVKGLDVLVEAIAISRARGEMPWVYLVGSGPSRGDLEARIAELDLGGQISFVGPVPHEHLADWYRAADLTVLPSHSEGLPNVLRESHACGTPFVASRVGGIAEIADELSDHLVPAGDPLALADAIELALRTPKSATVQAHEILDWSESARSLVRLVAPPAVMRREGGAPRRGAAAGMR